VRLLLTIQLKLTYKLDTKRPSKREEKRKGKKREKRIERKIEGLTPQLFSFPSSPHFLFSSPLSLPEKPLRPIRGQFSKIITKIN